MTAPAWLARFPSEQVRALDPSRHALIEASAGTGKTFAIEHLVLRLLLENPEWKPEEILLLSFTDKTVADLRTRIRSLLRRQLGRDDAGREPVEGWSPEDLDRIHHLWLHADDLSVHTLHGFCHGTLLRDPVAHGALIRADIADDRTVADHALENLLRGSWARDPGRLARLQQALGIDAGDGWRSRLTNLALAWQSWRGDRFEPAPEPGGDGRLDEDVRDAVSGLRAAVANVDAGSLPLHDYLSRLPERQRESHPFARMEALLGSGLDDDALATAFVETFYGKYAHGEEKTGRTKAYREGFVSALDTTRTRRNAALDEWTDLARACDALLRLGLRAARERILEELRLTAEAAMELRGEFEAEKLRRGLISYDDMPRNLARAIGGSPVRAARVRSRYKACIVDEFQDTDPLQWDILQHLCLRDSSGNAPDDEGARLPALPLFLVGDPKQAIYGFRGGDLRTYLSARAAFHALAGAGRAQGFGLEANYRSRPGLIAGLNAAFARAEWFGAPAEIPADPAWHLPTTSGDVTFTPALAGRREEDGADSRARIFLRDFTATADEDGPGKKADVERELRDWIAARVVAAIGNGRTPGDIAVLVRRNAEGQAIERALRRRGVACRLVRRGGLYHGPHADALRLLLEWIDGSGDPAVQARILLLPFARAKTADVPRGRPAACPPLVTRWATLARAGRWPEFFESVLHEGGYLARLTEESPSEAERIRRVARALGEAGAATGVSTRVLRERFDALRRGEGGDDEAAPGGESGETREAVSILTLHMSKGLEFPVVFVATTGDGKRDDHFVLHPPGRTGFLIALDTRDPDAKALQDRQSHDEDKRLFYVAFTRAAEELHVPLLPAAEGRRRYGPLGGFAADALRGAACDPATAPLFRFDQDPVQDRILAAPISVHSDATAPDRTLLAARTVDAFARRRRLASYSRLARDAGTDAATAPADPLLDEGGARTLRQEPVEERGAADATEDIGAIGAGELPPGADAGTALHAILERTTFSSARRAADAGAWLTLPGHRDMVEDALRRASVDPACAPAAARAVWNALRAPLPDPAGGPAFRLADLPDASDYRHEVEFLLAQGGTADASTDLPDGVARRGDFLWGFIDLVHRHEGRYYLLDWKSNLLPAYDDASVRRSMDEHRYDLQWKLYAVALHRWLETRLPGYDPDEHFGGVHYLYLRGTSPERFRGFAHRPGARQLREEYPAEIARLLGSGMEDPS